MTQKYVRRLLAMALALSPLSALAGAGPAPYSFNSPGHPIYFGRDYGMKCDGTTDDTAALQATINAANHGIVQLPSGECNITSSIIIENQVGVIQGTGAQTQWQTYPVPFEVTGTVISDYAETGDSFIVRRRDGVVFRDFFIWAGKTTGGAGISVSGPHTTLTGTVTSGATSLPVTASTNFINGDPVSVVRNDGTLYAGTVNGVPGATSIPITPNYSGANASSTNDVWGMSNHKSRFQNLFIYGAWDAVRLDNAAEEHFSDNTFQDYGNTGIKKLNAAAPDWGDGAIIGNRFNDQSFGVSRACIEYEAGSAGTAIIGNKCFKGDYGILINAKYGQTNNERIQGNSIEEQKVCSVALKQGQTGITHGGTKIEGNEFSMSGAGTGKLFCIDAGDAASWAHDISFSNNLATTNDATAGRFMVDVLAGDRIRVAGNQLENNNAANATAIHMTGVTNGTVEFNKIARYATSYNLAAGVQVLDMESITGTGGLVQKVSPVLTTPNIGVASGTSLALNGNPATTWQSDYKDSTLTVGNGASAALPLGSGLVIVNDTNNNGGVGIYAVGGSSAALIANSLAGKWVAPTASPGAGTASVYYDGSVGYRIANNFGASTTLGVALLRTKADK